MVRFPKFNNDRLYVPVVECYITDRIGSGRYTEYPAENIDEHWSAIIIALSDITQVAGHVTKGVKVISTRKENDRLPE